MKKLIAIAVVFALVAGAAFAVDVSGTVFGHFNLLQGDTGDDSKVGAGGGMDRLRIDGSGEVADGAFGGYIRMQKNPWENFVGVNAAYAWWKPIDQFKLFIGCQSDAFWGKEGVTGWGFNQMPNDSSVATLFGIWDSGIYCADGKAQNAPDLFAPGRNRYTFLEGFSDWGLGMEIKPLDMVSVNLALPFNAKKGKEAADVFAAALAQVDLHFDFGNIALTYDGAADEGDGAFFAYFGGSFGDLGLDVGIAYHFTGDNDKAKPLGFGVGLKYASGSFGLKFRATMATGGDDKFTYVNTSILPYFAINDNLTVFVNAGLGIMSHEDSDNAFVGFYVNPYVRVGAEWGPSFYVGLKLESALSYDGKQYADITKDSVVKFAVPVALMVSF